MKEYIIQAYDQKTIDTLDAHNAQDLIRCKDCKHFEESDNPSDRGYCWLNDAKFHRDGYCSHAEKAEQT